MIRVKYKVVEVNRHPGGGRVRLTPLIKDEANAQVFRFAPAGAIEIRTLNESAIGQFRQGAEFFVDFTPVLAQ